MFGENIKIHFAGSDNSIPHMIAADMAGVNYSLFTCYGFIAKKKPTDDFRFKGDELFVPKLIEPKRKHIIMDSGLFTLMFGAEKGKVQTIETLTEWQDKTAQFVNQNNLNCSCVEIDCQKVLGIKEAWYFRQRMKKVMPNNRHINVFHMEDGKDGLDALIEFADYIAVSVPEWRIHKPKTYKDHVSKLAYYIKNKKPSIDIHLLGCTEKDLLARNKFCTSADSTSWLAANRYARIQNTTHTIYDIKQSARDEIEPHIWHQLSKYGKIYKFDVTDKKIKYIQDAYFSALICKNAYAKVAGNQD